MGCGGSTGKKERCNMKKTSIQAADDTFGKFQDVIEEFYKLKDPVANGKHRLMKNTGFDKVPGAKVTHAVSGSFYAFSAKVQGDLAKELDLKFMGSSPFVSVNPAKLGDELKAVYDAFEQMVKDLVKAVENLPSILPKCEDLANSAKDLPAKAKEEMQAKSMSPIEIGKSMGAIKKNVTQITSSPGMIKDTIKKLGATLNELKEALKMLEKDKDKLGSKGAELGKAGKTQPKVAYEAVYGEIKVTKEEMK